MKPIPIHIIVGLLTLLLGAGCMTQSHLDRQIEDELEFSVLALPQVTANALQDALQGYEDYGKGQKLELDLPLTLKLASQFNRTQQTERDKLHLATLELLGTRRDFGIQYSGTLEYILDVKSENEAGDAAQADIRVSRIIPTGGQISLNAESNRRDQEQERLFRGTTNRFSAATYRSTVSLRLTQPILAGAGYEASHAELIQAEQELRYAIRSFALQRQDFALDVMRNYYNLLNQKSVLENTRKNVEQSTFLRERSEALFKIRMAPAIDVLRSQQQELTALNQLANAEADFDIQLKRFLITLGVPIHNQADITGQFPAIKPLDLAEWECIENAMKNRMDLQTARDRYVDAQRGLRISRRNMLPQLNLFGDVIYTGDSDEGYVEQDLEEEVRAGIRLEIPFDQRDERDAIRMALIGAETARRNVRETEDQIRVGIVENLKRLKVFEITVTIQKKNMEISEKRARNAVLRFKSGEFSNRDVVEAENELLLARNGYVRALTDYELQRIRLQRDMGMLDLGPEGELIEWSDDRVRMIFDVNSLQKKQDEK